MTNISVKTVGDENAQVAVATYTSAGTGTISAVGTSKRDPGDKVDVQLGKDIAEGRAVRRLGRILLADANRRVRAAAAAQAKQDAAIAERKNRKIEGRRPYGIPELRSVLLGIVAGMPNNTNPRIGRRIPSWSACVYQDEAFNRCLIGEVAFRLGWTIPPSSCLQGASKAGRKYGWPVTDEVLFYLDRVQSTADARDLNGGDLSSRLWGDPRIRAAIEA